MESEIIRIIKDNLAILLNGSRAMKTAELNNLWNLSIMYLSRQFIVPYLKGIRYLSREEKARLRSFYKPYIMHITDRYHRLAVHRTGKLYPEIIPEELYEMHIDRYFSDRRAAVYLDNKCYYYRLLNNIKLPQAVAMRIGQTWLDGELSPIPRESVAKLLEQEHEVVIKLATNSEGGFGVKFLPGKSAARTFEKWEKRLNTDIVIQRPVKQHQKMALLHPQSVNTLRIVSLLTDDKVKIYAVCVRIGTGNSRIDNGFQGGIYCGVNRDGSLKDFGLAHDGRVVKTHPDLGYSFSDMEIPNLGNAVKLVKKAHPFMGHFRIISWDIAIDDDGEAVLVEANFSMGGIDELQCVSGPLFGRDTKKILNEVFKNRKMLTTLI